MTFSAMFWLWAALLVLWCVSWWLAYREHKLVFWFLWNTVVGFIAWSALLLRVVGGVWIWMGWWLSVSAIPLWWLWRWLFRSAAPPAVHDDFSDLKPLDRERGERW